MNTLNEKSERIKKSRKGIAKKSKETIREISSTNTKFIGEAFDSNKKNVSSITEKLNEQELEGFGKAVELAEDAPDSIINSYIRQMEMKLVDVLIQQYSFRKSVGVNSRKFEASPVGTNNTKEILDFYNEQ